MNKLASHDVYHTNAHHTDAAKEFNYFLVIFIFDVTI